MKKIIVLGIFSMVIIGGLSYWFYQSKIGIKDVGKNILDPKNCTYIIGDKNITLKNGYAEEQTANGSISKIITQYFGNETVAYFNGDNIKDVAFLLTQNSGGTGTFYYAVVALSTKNGCIGTNAVLLGDRIAPQTTEYNNGEIIINYADRLLNEPMSASPSVGVSKYLKIVDDKLVVVIKTSTQCVPNWQCGWGSCVNGSQVQVAVDSNNCGLSVETAEIACSALARLCIDSTQPSITSILPTPATVGSNIIVTGKNLNGFEGDKNIWIKNGAGQKGIIYGERDNLTTTIKFTLADKYCAVDTSYSGVPCPSYITITPGSYLVFVENQNGISNTLNFKVTAKTSTVTKTIGDKEFNYLIEKINYNSIEGLWYTLYPVAKLQGDAKTLQIGDVVGYACEGKTATLLSIDTVNQTVIFNETITNPPMGGCPI
jgi:hypothetical protein